MRIMRASFPLRHLKPKWGDHIMLIISRICLIVKAEEEVFEKESKPYPVQEGRLK